MDSEDRFSFILSGSQKLAARIRAPQNEPLKQRIGFSHNLRALTIDDAQAYVRFHLQRAEGPADLFTDTAAHMIFHLAKGLPRVMNQIALLALIRAAIHREASSISVTIAASVLSRSPIKISSSLASLSSIQVLPSFA